MSHRIRIGNQTAFSAVDPMDPFEFAVSQGFDAFEWFADKKVHEDATTEGWDFHSMDRSQRQETKRLGEVHEIWYSVHAPWQANPLHPHGNDLLMESLDFARDIGARLVNLHLYMDRGAEGYVDALAPVIDYAANTGVRLSIENTPLTTPADVNQTFACLRDRGAGHVGLCLDIGHANLCDPTRNDYIRYFDELDRQVPLIHTHVHENYGDSDSHLTLFTGPAAENDGGIRAFVSRLKQRHYEGAAILEQWPQPPELLVEAVQRLRQLSGGSTKKRRRRQSRESEQKASSPIRSTAVVDASDIANLVDTSNLSDPFAIQIVNAHLTHISWRERLGWVAESIANPEHALGIEEFAMLAVYLRFVGTGEAPCAEDGRHFRPNHHARTALAIERTLSDLETPDNAWVLRKIYPWLPSYSDEFQHREPLTRIRDIAHRNDIPTDLKREIKHRLQNKLHRCAGPEDLKTSEEILGRITAPGTEYSRDFVAQFQIFHQELSEFFNASSLESRLAELASSSARALTKPIQSFLRLKKKKPRSDKAMLALIESLTGLREALAGQLEQAQGAEAQRLRLSDIALEDYAFVLLSECANRLEGFADQGRWEEMFRVLKAVLTNTRLSLIEPDESTAVFAEVEVWSRDFNAEAPDQMHRLMATLERMRRLAELYTDQVLALFPPRVSQLGHALGVQEHAIQVFCEGDIRGNLVFQLSKLADMARSAVRLALALSPWEVLVPGEASGTLVKTGDLQAIAPEGEPLITLLERAEGDEEIPARVRGIILCHPIPHLSHLGVRARQGLIPLVTTDDSQALASLEGFVDQSVSLRVAPETVTVAPVVSDPRSPEVEATQASVSIPQVEMVSESQCWALSEARLETCGAKATGARDLLALAQTSEGAFRALDGQALPFGVMEHCLSLDPEREQAYKTLQATLEQGWPQDAEERLHQLRTLVRQIPVPTAVVAQMREFFGETTRLAVRSSANSEDLEAFAGAGLYDSIIGVPAADSGSAIQRVWASLWTRRATLSRRQAGIGHADVHMAVLVQPMVEPDLSFIMHTTDPATGRQDRALVELAVGLGETLASACQPGTPYRLECDRNTGKSTLVRFASYSFDLRPSRSASEIVRKRLNYAKVPLSSELNTARVLGRRLAKIASFLEDRLGRAQDVEGALVGDDIYVVQTRAQQGLDDSEKTVKKVS